MHKVGYGATTWEEPMKHHTWREGTFYGMPAVKPRAEKEILQAGNF